MNIDTINTSQTPAIAYVGESISDTATVTGLVSPSSSDTVTFNLYSRRREHALLFTDANVPLSISGSTGTATSTGYTAAGHGHRLLGGDLQRRHQQRRGQQRHHRRAGEHRHDHHQPDAGHRLCGRVDQRHGHGHGPGQPQRQRYGDVQPLQQQHGQRHAAVHRHRDGEHQRQHGHGHVGGLHPPRAWAPSTGWRPSTATPTTPPSPAAPPPRR